MSLPMISRPNDWVLKTKELSTEKKTLLNLPNNFISHEIISGGQLINFQSSTFKFIKHYDIDSFTYLSLNDFNTVNKIQLQKYQINKKVLAEIQQNLPYFLLCYLSKFFETEEQRAVFRLFDAKTDKDVPFLKIKSYDQDTLKSFKDLSLMFFSGERYVEKICNKMESVGASKYDISEKRLELNIFYTKVILHTHRFLETISIADVYKDEKSLYFSAFLDYRLRLYPLAGLLSYQGDNLSKSLLIKVRPESNKIISELNKNEMEFLEKESFLDNKKNFDKDPSKVFLHMRDKIGATCSFITIDATNSGLSIVSALVGCLNGLLWTNVLHDSVAVDNLKGDFYTKVVNIMRSDSFKEQLDKDCSPILKEIIKEKDNKNSYELFARKCINFYIKLFYERDFVKDLVISFLYSEGIKSRKEKLLHLFDKEKLLSNIFTIEEQLFYKKDSVINDIIGKIG